MPNFQHCLVSIDVMKQRPIRSFPSLSATTEYIEFSMLFTFKCREFSRTLTSAIIDLRIQQYTPIMLSFSWCLCDITSTDGACMEMRKRATYHIYYVDKCHIWSNDLMIKIIMTCENRGSIVWRWAVMMMHFCCWWYDTWTIFLSCTFNSTYVASNASKLSYFTLADVKMDCIESSRVDSSIIAVVYRPLCV